MKYIHIRKINNNYIMSYNYEYKYTETDQFTMDIYNWLCEHPVTSIKFTNVCSESKVITISLLNKEYVYDNQNKTLIADNEPMLSINDTVIEQSNLSDILTVLHKIGEQVKPTHMAPIKPLVYLNDDDDDMFEADPITIEIESELQLARRHRKSMRVYYVKSDDVVTIYLTIIKTHFTCMFKYIPEMSEYSEPLFPTLFPEKLFVDLLIKKWLLCEDSLSERIVWLTDSIESTSERDPPSELCIFEESKELFDIHNITFDAFEWSDDVATCNGERMVEHERIVELLQTICNKFENGPRKITTEKLNSVYPIVYYYMASEVPDSLINNIEIYNCLLTIMEFIKRSFTVDEYNKIKYHILPIMADEKFKNIPEDIIKKITEY